MSLKIKVKMTIVLILEILMFQFESGFFVHKTNSILRYSHLSYKAAFYNAHDKTPYNAFFSTFYVNKIIHKKSVFLIFYSRIYIYKYSLPSMFTRCGNDMWDDPVARSCHTIIYNIPESIPFQRYL